MEYDKALVRAREAGVGVHSPEGLEKLDYHYKTYAERTGRPETPPPPKLGPLLGQGLMFTGQSGALKPMGRAGNAIAQSWNAALAAIGAREFNQKAKAKPDPAVFRRPRDLLTDTEAEAERRRLLRKP